MVHVARADEKFSVVTVPFVLFHLQLQVAGEQFELVLASQMFGKAFGAVDGTVLAAGAAETDHHRAEIALLEVLHAAIHQRVNVLPGIFPHLFSCSKNSISSGAVPSSC